MRTIAYDLKDVQSLKIEGGKIIITLNPMREALHFDPQRMRIERNLERPPFDAYLKQAFNSINDNL